MRSMRVLRDFANKNHAHLPKMPKNQRQDKQKSVNRSLPFPNEQLHLVDYAPDAVRATISYGVDKHAQARRRRLWWSDGW